MVQSGRAISFDLEGGLKHLAEWLPKAFDYLHISTEDRIREICVTRHLSHRLSNVAIQVVRGGSFYATEQVDNGDTIIVTDDGNVPRKYFLTDASVAKVVKHFLKTTEQDPEFEWVPSDTLFKFWDQ